jgi:hypothetical protein
MSSPWEVRKNNYSVYTVALNISSCAVTAQIYNSKLLGNNSLSKNLSHKMPQCFKFKINGDVHILSVVL